MDINRDNYEEYFLLYADDELSKAERRMVEIFVKENPDLKEEFCMCTQHKRLAGWMGWIAGSLLALAAGGRESDKSAGIAAWMEH